MPEIRNNRPLGRSRPASHAARSAFAAIALAVLLSGCQVSNLVSGIESDPPGYLEITEIQTENKTTLCDMYGDYPAWFELRNGSDETLDLSRYSVSDNRDNPGKWSLPAENLEPGGVVLVFASGRIPPEGSKELHASFKLSKEEKALYVYSGRILVDSASFGALANDRSWVRGSGSSLLPCLVPTPGTANSSTPAVLQFSLPAGFYRSSGYPSGLEISLSSGLPIRYTTDGSDPTLESPLYDGSPVHVPVPDPATGGLPSALVLKAALEYGGSVSAPLCHTYILDGESDIGVFSISTAPGNLWSEADGIFWENGSDSNLYEDLEHRVHLEYFDEEGNLALDMDAGLTSYGAYSRTFPQKSMALYARSAYGEGSFKYDFFGKRNCRGAPVDSFESLVLRNSGNDWDSTMIRDSFMTSLLDGDDVPDGLCVDHQACRPVAVYLNGSYWGFYFLREKIGRSYLSGNHPETGRAGYDLIANYYETMEGDTVEYESLLSYLGEHSLADQASYDAVAARVDIGEFIDYQIFNIYVDNEDWPGNNIKYWRPRIAGGSWRWIAFDTDFGFGLQDAWNGRAAGSFNTLQFALLPDGTEWPNYAASTFMLRSLMANPGFSKRFYTRFDELLSGRFSSARALGRLDAMEKAVEKEITSRHLLRWKDSIWWADKGISEESAQSRTAQWRANIEWMRDFARARPERLRSFYDGWDVEVTPVRGNGNGLLGSYFGNTALAGDATPRTDAQVNFNWTGDGLPVPGISGQEYFSVRWTGQLESSFTGPVRLYLTADDGVRLSLGGVSLIDAWVDQGATTYTATVEMTAGERYPLEIEYYQGSGAGSVRFEWSRGMFRETVPESQLYAD